MIIRIVVVFPAPFGPRKPRISPLSTRKLTSVDGRRSVKRLRKSLYFEHLFSVTSARGLDRHAAGGPRKPWEYSRPVREWDRDGARATTPRRPRRAPSVVIWAVNYPAMKVAFREMSPLAFTGLAVPPRDGVPPRRGARSGASRLVPPPGARGLALVLALSGVGVYQWLYALGLASTSGFSAALLNSISPLIAMLLVVLLGWERMSPLAGARLARRLGRRRPLRRPRPAAPDFGSTAGNLLCLGRPRRWAVYNVASAARRPAAVAARRPARDLRAAGPS